jgi:hypothetical protein
MRWYDVKMSGRYNGEPCEVDETVQAGDQETAVQYALMEKFGVCFSTDIGCEYAEMDGSGLRPLVFTLGERGRFITDHERLSDVVAEGDPVRVAKLTGAPELPLDLEEETAEGQLARQAFVTDRLPPAGELVEVLMLAQWVPGIVPEAPGRWRDRHYETLKGVQGWRLRAEAAEAAN